jgi:hypothetical protein
MINRDIEALNIRNQLNILRSVRDLRRQDLQHVEEHMKALQQFLSDVDLQITTLESKL